MFTYMFYVYIYIFIYIFTYIYINLYIETLIAIGARLQQEGMFGPLVAPESVEMEPDSENEHVVVDID